MSDWKKIARPDQILPIGNWKIWLILAGRGFGKTRAGAEAVLELITSQRAKNIGILGETIFEARNIMINGHSGILTNTKMEYKYSSIDRKIIFTKEKACCQFFGADKYNKLRGFQFDLVWIDEFAKFNNCENVLNQVFMCLRLGESKMIITTTPRNKKTLLDLMIRDDIFITRGSSFDNKSLSQEFIKTIDQYKNTTFGQQEIFANIVDNNLWNINDILYKIPEKLEFLTIGIDPAIENGTTGIILAGINNDIIYILDDFSISGKPQEWMHIIKKICNENKNIEIAVEVNQGGNMIIELMNLYQIDKKIYKYRAYNSKHERNIISHTLYQQNKIFHAKKLEKLEDEMLYNPKDRVDALYWAIYNLRKRKEFSGFIV